MTNLLAILISMAMLLTGASTATLEEAALGRVVTIGNLVVTRNDEEVDLDPYAVLGITTDGEQALYDFYVSKGFSNPAVIIDTNHCNSGKRPLEQPRIVKEVLSNCRYNSDIRDLVKGFMIESYIEDGSQKIDEHIYGKSITDPCLGWEKTEKMILEVADLL